MVLGASAAATLGIALIGSFHIASVSTTVSFTTPSMAFISGCNMTIFVSCVTVSAMFFFAAISFVSTAIISMVLVIVLLLVVCWIMRVALMVVINRYVNIVLGAQMRVAARM